MSDLVRDLYGVKEWFRHKNMEMSFGVVDEAIKHIKQLEQKLSEQQNEWISASKQKPKQGDRVLLAIEDENCPVVGYWGCGKWEACTVNFYDECIFCEIEQTFLSSEVTHWKPITPPKEKAKTERLSLGERMHWGDDD